MDYLMYEILEPKSEVPDLAKNLVRISKYFEWYFQSFSLKTDFQVSFEAVKLVLDSIGVRKKTNEINYSVQI